jgi:glycosyltransferase involved in cell wall biosynthesis
MFGIPLNPLIVMPAFNESGSIAGVIFEVQKCLPGQTILVVDDGSTDTTVTVARDAGALVLVLPFNLGVGGAMRAGFRFAVAEGFDAVVQLDSDGQHNPTDIPSLLAGLSTSDLVVGARFAGVGDYKVAGPRAWAMSALSRVLSSICDSTLTDTTSGFKASGPRALRLFAADYPAEYLGDTIEALVIAAKAGCVVTQVPVAMRARTAGEPSHNAAKAGVYLFRAMLAVLVGLMRPRALSQVVVAS